MPREMRRQALRAAVAAKIASGTLSAVETLDVRDGKTKSLVTRLVGLGVADAPTLIVVRELDSGLARAARNVPWLTVETPAHVSVYQLLHAHRVVCERASLVALEEALSSSRTAREILIRPLMTEKSMRQKEEQNTVAFRVRPDANKVEIRAAVETVFNVKVSSVRTASFEGKLKRMGRSEGKRADWKKAIVTLAPGHKIELVEGA